MFAEALKQHAITHEVASKRQTEFAILYSVEGTLQTPDALIDALQTRKKGLMQRLLTGEVRENWQTYRLDDIAEVILSGVNKCHNHSTSFYKLLEQMLPDWESRRQDLNQWDFQ